MNPRAAINDLHPFQGCPFGQLGYFSMWQNSYSLLSLLLLNDSCGIGTRRFASPAMSAECIKKMLRICPPPDKTEKVGFEPTVPFGITGFQDQLLKPLGHLSLAINFLYQASNRLSCPQQHVYNSSKSILICQ